MRKYLVQLLIAKPLRMKAMQSLGAGPVLDSNNLAVILPLAIYKFICVIVQARVRLNALQAKPFFVKNSRKWIMM